MSDPPPYPDQERDELIFELIKKTYDDESGRIHSLDNKAGSLIGFVSVVVSLLIAEGAFKILDLLKNNSLDYLLPIYLAGLSILLLSIGFAFYGFMIKTWPRTPNVTFLINNYTNKSHEKVLQDNAVIMASIIPKIIKHTDKKAQKIQISMGLLLGGLGVQFVFIMMVIILISVNLSPP